MPTYNWDEAYKGGSVILRCKSQNYTNSCFAACLQMILVNFTHLEYKHEFPIEWHYARYMYNTLKLTLTTRHLKYI